MTHHTLDLFYFVSVEKSLVNWHQRGQQTMRQIKNTTLLFFLSLGLIQSLKAQIVTLSGDIYEYATYYVNSFDLNTGATMSKFFDISFIRMNTLLRLKSGFGHQWYLHHWVLMLKQPS